PEGTVPALPREGSTFRPPFLDPARRVRFHDTQAIGDREIGGEARENVDVVGGSANCNGNRAQLPQDSANVGVHVGANVIREERCAARGGKDDVREQVGEGVGHSCAPLEGRVLYTPGWRWGIRLAPATRAGAWGGAVFPGLAPC